MAVLTLVPELVESYAVTHTTAVSAIYERLREETLASTAAPQMQVGPLEGRLLMLLARLSGARRAVEVGTFTGYSALSIAEGMGEGGRLITCDIDPVNTAIARRYFDEAPWGDRIELRLGPASDTLRAIEGPLDLVFIDADKGGYIDYWEQLVPKVRSGGVLLADNVLWSGRVLDPSDDSDRALVRFNRHVQADTRVDHVMLTVRDGLTLAVKR
ncbi:MAG: class I SAM-dependent methyltransferase [Deltaproteobacteria bacterium]|nr:class I SAM-dependent methyltransferase [Deltaproteobacteria bacterium]MCB9788745.1 class I SAM-dependent methyltransferase [Deltaproteobacteria bacterium]